jgi:hypothetical protein
MTLGKAARALAIGAAITGWVAWTIYSDYHWAAATEREKSSAGWVVAAKGGNLIDLIRPWTIIRQPIDSLWFVRPNDITTVSADIVFVQALTVTQQRDSVLGSEYLARELVNCSNRTDSFLADKDPLENLDLNKLQWHSLDTGTPGAQLIDFVCLHRVSPSEAAKREQRPGGGLLLMTSSAWDGLSKDQQSLYVKAFLEAVSFIMYGYVPHNSQTVTNFSDWTACAKQEPPSRWTPLDWVFGNLNQTAVSQFFKIASAVCQKDVGKGDRTWNPVYLVSKADWSTLSPGDREIYVKGYVETSYEMLKRMRLLNQVRAQEDCVGIRGMEGIMKEVDATTIDWRYPLPWSVSQGLGSACREVRNSPLKETK